MRLNYLLIHTELESSRKYVLSWTGLSACSACGRLGFFLMVTQYHQEKTPGTARCGPKAKRSSAFLPKIISNYSGAL